MTTLAFDPATLPFAERIHWQSRKDWLSGRVTHSSLIVVAALWGFSVLWCAAIGFIFTVNRAKIATAINDDWTEAIVPAFAAALGIIVVLCAIGATLSWLRNGKSALVLGTRPAFAGETFEGTVEAGRIIAEKSSFAVTLTCERVTEVRRRDPSSKSRRRQHSHFHRELLGKVTKTITAVPSPGANGLFSFPVTMNVPDFYPGSLHEENGTGIQWTLHVQSANGQSPVFGAAFEVPVYRREDLVER